MRIGRPLRWILCIALAGVLLTALIVYCMISRIPSEYRPRQLTLEEQEAGMRKFVNHISEFGEKAG
ncbi:unnamed protein product, partial [marine sediment metagenome]